MSDKSDTPKMVAERITDYLTSGGLFNPELANHTAVRDLLIDARDELAQARAELAAEEIRHGQSINCQKIERARADKAEAERDALRGFVAAVFEESGWPNGGDIDGFAFQDAAIAAGLLTGETRTVPCGESCHCAEYHGDISEGVTCYRKAPWLLAAAINAARAK